MNYENSVNSQENVDYKELYENLLNLPNCNTCGIRSICKIGVKPGQVIRINCPFWVENQDLCNRQNKIYYAVILDWSYQGADEINVLCITKDILEAKYVFEKAIKKEKSSSWISNVAPTDIGGDDFEYTEIISDTAWSFYETGSHSIKHTDITIFKYDEADKSIDTGDCHV